MEKSRWFLRLFICLAASAAGPAFADGTRQPVRPASAWKMERLVTKDGKTHEGLAESQRGDQIIFLEIVRPPGRPLFAVRRPIAEAEIQSLERLPPSDREAFQAKWWQYLRRARIESLQLDRLELQKTSSANEPPRWRYQGPWFEFTCQAGEQASRQTIVHLEQVFGALHQALPPRRVPGEPHLSIHVFANHEAYLRFSANRGLAIENAAYFAAVPNQIVVHCPLERIAQEAQAAVREHEALRGRLETQRKDVPERLKKEREKLERANRPEAEIRQIIIRLRSKLNQEQEELQRSLDRTDRQNRRTVEEQTAAWLKTLRHEAFHAYLQNYLFPLPEYRVPRWLHEGLAQVFAHSVLEDGLLRVDSPDPELLARLQADLRGQPLSLSRVLQADHREFLVVTPADQEGSQRLYAYAWGVVWYLLFEDEHSWTVDDLARLVAAGDDDDVAKRFAEIAGEPLAAFEARWRSSMLKLKKH